MLARLQVLVCVAASSRIRPPTRQRPAGHVENRRLFAAARLRQRAEAVVHIRGGERFCTTPVCWPALARGGCIDTNQGSRGPCVNDGVSAANDHNDIWQD